MTTTGSTLYHPVHFNREYFAGRMLEKYAEKNEKIWSDLGIGQREMAREEFLSSLVSLEESLATGSPAFLLDHARWMQSRYTADNFPPGFAISFFKAFGDIVKDQLPEDYRKTAAAFTRKTVTFLKSLPPGTGADPDTGTPVSPDARLFLDFVLAGNVAKGRAVIDKALAAGTPVSGIYTGIFRPVLAETGRLWQQNRVTIAEEHFVTGVIRRIMEQVHDQIARTGRIKRKKKTVVAACVGNELHEVGIRMVADFFELDGWNVYTTGASTPAKSILAAVKDRKADVVAISITMPSGLSGLQYLVRSLRADRQTAHVKIIVGGSPFTVMPDLWKQVGADAVAASAEDAVTVANRLTA
ncbi:MAG: cobalamin-dependent protein [Methanoregula sp.]|jgi:methanogenic corrinoid protein MtbC1